MIFQNILRKYLLPFFLGGISVLAFAPFNFYLLIFLSLIGLLFITNKNESANIKSIVDKTNILLNDTDVYNSMSVLHNPYGNGNASIKIVNHILSIC